MLLLFFSAKMPAFDGSFSLKKRIADHKKIPNFSKFKAGASGTTLKIFQSFFFRNKRINTEIALRSAKKWGGAVTKTVLKVCGGEFFRLHKDHFQKRCTSYSLPTVSAI
jgi:hypothetical protein